MYFLRTSNTLAVCRFTSDNRCPSIVSCLAAFWVLATSCWQARQTRGSPPPARPVKDWLNKIWLQSQRLVHARHTWRRLVTCCSRDHPIGLPRFHFLAGPACPVHGHAWWTLTSCHQAGISCMVCRIGCLIRRHGTKMRQQARTHRNNSSAPACFHLA